MNRGAALQAVPPIHGAEAGTGARTSVRSIDPELRAHAYKEVRCDKKPQENQREKGPMNTHGALLRNHHVEDDPTPRIAMCVPPD